MAARKSPRSYKPYLEMDREGVVTMVDPVSVDDDSIVKRLGHVAAPRTDDDCPESLRDDLARLYRDFVRELMYQPGGRLELVRLHR